MTEPSDAQRKADELNLKMAQTKALAGCGCSLILLPFLIVIILIGGVLLYVIIAAAVHA